MGTYSTYAVVCSKLFGSYEAEKFSKEINGISANLLAGLFENILTSLNIIDNPIDITSSSSTQWAVKRHNLLYYVANKK